MQIVLYGLSALLMLSGLYGLVMGWDIIMVERGWSQFIAGATAFSAGAVILSLSHVAREVRKLRSDLSGLVVEVDEPSPVAASPALPATDLAVSKSDTKSDPKPDANMDAKATTDLAAAQTEAPSHERTMVGTYASSGVTYFMYSDHSIEAELPDGRHRFASMDDLRIYLDTGSGGEIVRKGPSEA
jgi:hypothetical protein